jgi:adenosylcobinamide kinase / adenosylcobinamide-phosphate guanylyltransferase
MHTITLITGGARSGKSAFALELARKRYSQKAFIATALAFDREMKERIRNHQKERGDAFRTVEEPLHLAEALMNLPRDIEAALVDCLTVWLGNLYHHCHENERTVREQVDAFLAALDTAPCDLILVTNEVGWGIVPDNPLARAFRDRAGHLNREMARKAQQVYLMCCGIPLALKGEGSHE